VKNPWIYIPLIENSQTTTKSIGVGMYPSLMGTFNFPAPVSYIHATLVATKIQAPRSPLQESIHLEPRIWNIYGCYPHPCESVKGDPIMEGILSCSLASSRGHPPIELPLQIQYFSSCLITLLEPLYIVLPSPKNILEEESSRSRTF
jgi:hypothetical protein